MFKFISVIAKILSTRHTVNARDVEEGIDSLVKTLTLAKTFSGEAVKVSDWIASSNVKKGKECVVNESHN